MPPRVRKKKGPYHENVLVVIYLPSFSSVQRAVGVRGACVLCPFRVQGNVRCAACSGSCSVGQFWALVRDMGTCLGRMGGPRVVDRQVSFTDLYHTLPNHAIYVSALAKPDYVMRRLGRSNGRVSAHTSGQVGVW